MKPVSVKTLRWVRALIADETTRDLAVTGALGSGKTHGAAQWFITRMLQNPEVPLFGIFQPIHRLLKTTTVPNLKKALTQFKFVEGKDYRFLLGQEPKLQLKATKQEAHLITARDPEMIVGDEYGCSWVDEAGANKAGVISKVKDRTRDRRANIQQILITGAPQGISNEFAQMFDSDVLPNWDRRTSRDHLLRVVDKESGAVYKKARRIRLEIDDNPFTPLEWKRDQKEKYRHNPNLFKSYILGYFSPLVEGVVYGNYRPDHDLNGPDEIEADPYREINLTFDFNNLPLAYVSLQMHHFDELGVRTSRWIAIEESDGAGDNLRETIITDFAVKHPVSRFRDTPIRVFGDRSGHAASHKIAGSDFDLIKSTLNELGYKNVTVEAWRGVVPEAESADALNRLFFDDLLLINQRCKNFRNSLQATTWKPGTRKIDKPTGEKHTHWSDSAKYWAWQIARDFKGKRIEQVYGFNR